MDDKLNTDIPLTTEQEAQLKPFAYAHLATGEARNVSAAHCELARAIILHTPAGRMQSMALTKLWETKNCSVASLFA